MAYVTATLEEAVRLIRSAQEAHLAGAPVTEVSAGQNLQAALDAGGIVRLEAGAVFNGSYTVGSNTKLVGGAGSRIVGSTGSAIVVRPGTRAVALEQLDLATGHPDVLRIGENTDAQRSVWDAPAGITLSLVTIRGHRGKRGIDMHGRDVLVDRCEIEDVYDPAGQDSQAIYVGNSPWNIIVTDCQLSAGSEVFLVGGDYLRTPGLVPSGIRVENSRLYRPLSWQTDGTSRKIKNIFELKTGRHVTLRNCTLSGCWQDGQAGEAVVLTPAVNGAPQQFPESGMIEFVTVEDNLIEHCATAFGLLGKSYYSYTLIPLRGVVVRRNDISVSRLTYGGRGQLATIGGEPGDLAFSNNIVSVDGSSFVYYYRGSVMTPQGALVTAGQLGRLELTDNYIGVVGPYGIMLDGYANLANTSSVGQLVVERNTFSGDTAMRPRVSATNVWV